MTGGLRFEQRLEKDVSHPRIAPILCEVSDVVDLPPLQYPCMLLSPVSQLSFKGDV